jgi:hypothetical protein
MVSILNEWMRDKDLLKWGCRHIDVKGIEDAKRKLKSQLREGEYIW